MWWIFSLSSGIEKHLFVKITSNSKTKQLETCHCKERKERTVKQVENLNGNETTYLSLKFSTSIRRKHRNIPLVPLISNNARKKNSNWYELAVLATTTATNLQTTYSRPANSSYDVCFETMILKTYQIASKTLYQSFVVAANIPSNFLQLFHGINPRIITVFNIKASLSTNPHHIHPLPSVF